MSLLITTHTELLNYIADKIAAETYLEIGVHSGRDNLDLINVNRRIGVDPNPAAQAEFYMGSDRFFAENRSLTGSIDLAFVDGLHEARQVIRDIRNCWEFLSEKGVIVVHDASPYSEELTHIPRDRVEWCGDVYRAVAAVESPKFTVDCDYGCCVIRKRDGALVWSSAPLCDWRYFSQNRANLLNLIDPEDAMTRILRWSG